MMPRPTRGVTIGLLPPTGALREGLPSLSAWLREVESHGIAQVCVGDHVSFGGGRGSDGLVLATAMLASTTSVDVVTGVYLLPLRHPVTVARQLATISQLAPGRLQFGVGIGGEDARELTNCGISPATRGRRMDEALEVLAGLAGGERFDYQGEFFQLDRAWIRPAPDPRPPLLVGGRASRALRRAGRFGDGWLALFVTPDGFRRSVEEVSASALEFGRDPATMRHGIQLWCGVDGLVSGRDHLREGMERFYGLPFERFEKYTVAGSPEEIAAGLTEFVAAGASSINLIVRSDGDTQALEAVAEVQRLLDARIAIGTSTR